MGAKDVAKAIIGAVGVAYDVLDKPVQQGAHELAAAIFKGSDGFVMYPGDPPKNQEQSNDIQPQHGLPPEATKQVEAPQQERGMEMEM